jgi:hypothetical protein
VTRESFWISGSNNVLAAVGRPQNADLIFGAVTFPFHQLVSFIGPSMVA